METNPNILLIWQAIDERRQLAEHLREVADDLFPLEDDE